MSECKNKAPESLSVAGVAQLVEQLICNQLTFPPYINSIFCQLTVKFICQIGCRQATGVNRVPIKA